MPPACCPCAAHVYLSAFCTSQPTPPLKHIQGRHAYTACVWSAGSKAHIALVTIPPSPQVSSDRLASQPNSADRLPQTASQKNPMENVANTQLPLCLAALGPINTACTSHPESCKIVPADPQATETHPGDQQELSSRHVAPTQLSYNRPANPFIHLSTPQLYHVPQHCHRNGTKT